MTQFTLNNAGEVVSPKLINVGGAHKNRVAFGDLDAFTQGYIEALFFMSECPQVDSVAFDEMEHQEAMRDGTADGTVPCDVGFSDLRPDTLARIIADCTAFQAKAADLLTLAYEHGGEKDDYDDAAAGRDFWYTRNGHGVGFWDRGLGDIGDKLSKLCGWRTEWAETNAYFDDGKVGLE